MVFGVRSNSSRSPLQITDALVGEIRGRLALGMPRAAAFRAAGVPERTGARWLQRGREAEAGAEVPNAELYGRLRDAVLEAEAEFLEAACRTVLAAGGPQVVEKIVRLGDGKFKVVPTQQPGDTRPLLRMMACRFPEIYSPESKLHAPLRLVELLADQGIEITQEQALRVLAGSEMIQPKPVVASALAETPQGREALQGIADNIRKLRMATAAPDAVKAIGI